MVQVKDKIINQDGKKDAFLGIDVGSVSCKFVLIDHDGNLLSSVFLRNKGSPIDSVKDGMSQLRQKIESSDELISYAIRACGTTGSARYLTKAVVGGDIAKTEIIAHAVGAQSEYPEVRTILEIGGQDSKIIILRDGIIVDFAMNSVCAAGTGSFLDHQAARLGIPIEQFGSYAVKSKNPVSIAGRCTVFAESDMIHKQNAGYSREDIIAGLCDSLVRNYLNNLAKGKDLAEPVVFQGGVSFNKGIVQAFERHLGCEVVVPKHNVLMGALGMAILVKDHYLNHETETVFRGLEVSEIEFVTSAFHCGDCPNNCEIVQVRMPEDENKIIARWGSRCGKWEVF
ncbi:MAG: 2-hydroxyglutaryl-CoA dehydratase [Candidatus Lokiarchaeota archaeon]|nr:2-hydroxyglutaryl-CoA dehydratase [Candidatus Lokiarchaeota archaeon]MBD3340855.1 2-hydroxyglutaryl-CoA dehydratase [Candidatus Lokiarchaeota archaeon]